MKSIPYGCAIMISVIIPTYNREKTIVPAVQSVLNQTFRDIEVIVVDDGSTDHTKEQLETIQDERLHYARQENAGACAARNHGIDLAQGEWIAFHDSDDLWREDKLTHQIEIMEQFHPDLVFCALAMHEAKAQDEDRITRIPKRLREGFLDPIPDLFGIGTQTILARKEVFENLRFDETMPRYQDLELLYRIAQRYSIYYLEEELVDYWVGEDSISRNPRKLYRALELMLERYPELPDEHPVMAMHMARNLIGEAWNLQRSGNPDRIPIKPFLQLAVRCRVNPLRAAAVWRQYYAAGSRSLHRG